MGVSRIDWNLTYIYLMISHDINGPVPHDHVRLLYYPRDTCLAALAELAELPERL